VEPISDAPFLPQILDQAVKACQGPTLKLIWPLDKKSLITLTSGRYDHPTDALVVSGKAVFKNASS
jgi:hypothetical protein